MKKEIKERIEKVIKELKLTKEEQDIIAYGNMQKICELAKIDMLDLMYYLRYGRYER